MTIWLKWREEHVSPGMKLTRRRRSPNCPLVLLNKTFVLHSARFAWKLRWRGKNVQSMALLSSPCWNFIYFACPRANFVRTHDFFNVQKFRFFILGFIWRFYFNLLSMKSRTAGGGLYSSVTAPPAPIRVPNQWLLAWVSY